MTEHAPEIIVQRAVSEAPDYYRPGVFGPALSFYYDLAGFKGLDGQTKLEVYYGIPPNQVEIHESADSALIHIKCALALADQNHTTIYRNTEEFVYAGLLQNFRNLQSAFVPEVLTSEVPPGTYELQIQVKDLISGRTGLYKQSFEVNDYRSESLHISDIEMAASIGTQGADKFKKADVWIIPMPTRTYSERQKVYAYFEVYNLAKNEFARTQYKTQYLVRSSSMPSVGLFGTVGTGFTSIFKRKKPQISVEYEQTGSETSEYEYVEIDLERAKPGINALEVTITDLVTGQEVTREVKFRYGN